MARILVIDDDRDYRSILKQFIESKGHTVIEAQDADQGLDVFLKEKIDLVVSDFMMPLKSGMELLRELREINPKVLFIMITGFGSKETEHEAVNSGAYDFLRKPVDYTQLTAVMNRALATLELRSNLTAVRGINVALLIMIPIWIVIGFLATVYFK